MAYETDALLPDGAAPSGAELVRFGPANGNVVTRNVLVELLTDFHEQQPELFGWYLARAISGVNPKGPRAQKQ